MANICGSHRMLTTVGISTVMSRAMALLVCCIFSGPNVCLGRGQRCRPNFLSETLIRRRHHGRNGGLFIRTATCLLPIYLAGHFKAVFGAVAVVFTCCRAVANGCIFMDRSATTTSGC